MHPSTMHRSIHIYMGPRHVTIQQGSKFVLAQERSLERKDKRDAHVTASPLDGREGRREVKKSLRVYASCGTATEWLCLAGRREREREVASDIE